MEKKSRRGGGRGRVGKIISCTFFIGDGLNKKRDKKEGEIIFLYFL